MGPSFETDAIFADRYRIVRTIAAGGMGTVYEVVHVVTQRRCALKVMHGHTIEREELRKRFLQESQVAAQIGSEYIVDVLDAGVDDRTGIPFLIMELLEGEDLGRRVVRLGRLSPEEAVRFLWDAALALDKTHQASIVHRDLKASNLFLTHREDGTPIVKVLDFGVAKVLPTEATSEGATQTVGTPIYMAPEQFRAGGRVSPSTDMYALGMLVYTLLVGAHYWKEEHERCENPFAFASLAVHGPTESAVARAERQGVALRPKFDAWFTKATARDPAARFPCATAAISALAIVYDVSMPDPKSEPLSGIDHVSSTSHALPAGATSLPETLESASAWSSPSNVSASRPGTGGSGSDSSLEGGHTEVSLSVTSGSLTAPSNRRRVALAAVASVVLIGGALSALLRDKGESAGAAGEATTKSSVAASTSNASSSPEEPRATRLEDLPKAEEDVPTRSFNDLPQASEGSETAATSRRKPVRRSAAPRQRTAPKRAPVEPAPPPNRQDLYGRH